MWVDVRQADVLPQALRVHLRAVGVWQAEVLAGQCLPDADVHPRAESGTCGVASSRTNSGTYGERGMPAEPVMRDQRGYGTGTQPDPNFPRT